MKQLELVGLSVTSSPRIEVEGLKPSIEAEEVEDAVRGFFQNGPELDLQVSLTKRPYRGTRKAYALLEEQGPWSYSRRPTSRLGGSTAGSVKRWRTIGAIAVLASVTWRRTTEGLTTAGAAGDVARKGRSWEPAQGNRSATFAPLWNALGGISRGSPQKEALRRRD